MDESEQERRTPEVEDLDVPDAESRDVKGGLLRPGQGVKSTEPGGSAGGLGGGTPDPAKTPSPPGPLVPIPYPNRS